MRVREENRACGKLDGETRRSEWKKQMWRSKTRGREPLYGETELRGAVGGSDRFMFLGFTVSVHQ